MPYVITQSCCNDASCTAACPVDCIHPRIDDDAFTSAESLYIDPEACIDCGACVEQCPVDAIVADDELAPSQQRFLDISVAYFSARPIPLGTRPRPLPRPATDLTGVRVAVVGTGPAAMYAVWELLEHRGVEVELYDRALTPYGLIRSGVAPDHPATKAVMATFERAARKPNVTMHFGVEVGTHVSHDELLAHHSAVIYATGAAQDRESGVPGAQLRGVHSAIEFVGWYNGDPARVDATFDLSGERAVVIGNGNVAIDVARILLTDPDTLASTDIADHALAALRHSNIREVVLLGRRGPAQAAYTNPELMALLDLPDVDVIVDPEEATLDELTRDDLACASAEPAMRLKAQLAQEISARPSTGAAKRIVLRYLASPIRFGGDDTVSTVHVARNSLVRADDGTLRAKAGAEVESLDASLVLQSVGYRGAAIAGVPFDDAHAVIPNRAGRVLTNADGTAVPRTYVTGWIKRGPSGVIGSNKRCARETVGCLLDDVANGLIPPAPECTALLDLLAGRRPEAFGYAGWSRIDVAERLAGRGSSRPRVKFTDVDGLRRAARP
ncbi:MULTISPECIES: FAD-dependent oxidoreductase [unclassified Mycobacterium]|uniref:FAD-dependent oxidoreductase n=1 Tax=unclassified Mycobacterium TaxID=2642494 RepID=UPI0029C8E7F3|nr:MULTISPECIES: FAD-dependent oxidoreductase [unclassified Mycobacterium]